MKTEDPYSSGTCQIQLRDFDNSSPVFCRWGKGEDGDLPSKISELLVNSLEGHYKTVCFNGSLSRKMSVIVGGRTRGRQGGGGS